MTTYPHTAEAEFAFADDQRVTVKGVPFDWDGKQPRDIMAAAACAKYIGENTIIYNPLTLVWVSCKSTQ